MFEFSWLDWSIIAIIAVSTLLSLKRGFFKESFSLFIWLFAILCSVMFSDQLAVYLKPLIESPSIRKVVAMALLFIASLLIGGLVQVLMGQLITFTGLSATDRVFGMVFGALRGILIVVVVLIFAKKLLPVEQEAVWKTSVLAPKFNKLELWTVEKTGYLSDLVKPLLQTKKS